jgi:hypothetical protein
MRKIISAFGILSITTVLILLIGYFLLNWKVTTVIPFSVVSLILFFNWLSIVTIKTKIIGQIGALIFFLQVVLLSLFLFEVIEIALIWKWMFLFLIVSFLLFLHDLIFRYSALSKRKLFSLISGILMFVIVCLSFLYLQNQFTNNLVYGCVIAYSIFTLFCIWTNKKQVL